MPDFRPQEPRQPKPARASWRETLEALVVAMVLAFGVHATVAEARYIPSVSMVPTLKVGDRLLVEKLSPRFGLPKRGDILVFYPPAVRAEGLSGRLTRWLGWDGSPAYIKRVVGLPGETIAVKDGRVLINGAPLPEPYLRAAPEYVLAPYRIPANHLYMLGDNRNNSQDSHVWGPLPVDNVIGHAAVRFWPLDRLGST